MNWLVNLSTRGKLMLSLGVMLLFFMTLVVVSYKELTAVFKAQERLYNVDFANVFDINRIRAQQNSIRADILAVSMNEDPEFREKKKELMQEMSEDVTARLKALKERNRNNQLLARLVDEFSAIRTVYSEVRGKMFNLFLQGKAEEAKKIAFGVQEERIEQLRTIAREISAETEKNAYEAVLYSEKRIQRALAIFWIVSILAIALSVLIVVVLNRLIAAPLKQLSGIAENIAAGDLRGTFDTDHRMDEVGVLMLSFKKMAENLRRLTGDLADGVQVLGSAAGEILATTTQMAAGASETATAVSQTTATVEEVKQTSHVSNQKAMSVSQSAQKSSQISQEGKKAVNDTIEKMDRVRQQMESIAASIVKLSEQSQSIGEIIATVNDLAEQSNLLSVNAAIEAAKAGEQGRGFAVVAQEVKSLAEQSKQATAQVRSILNEIQRATSAAVMATEQGNKAVESGVIQSREAGEAISLLSGSLTESAQAATQIAASSQQQLVGMDQMALAMENIKQASTQNVAATKQAEVSAQRLHELGQKIKGLMEQFKI